MIELPEFTAGEIAKASDRQLRHRLAKTDGESPYYTGPDRSWDADLWRMDIDILIADYFRLSAERWKVTKQCPDCDGKGEKAIPRGEPSQGKDWFPCQSCGGKGRI